MRSDPERDDGTAPSGRKRAFVLAVAIAALIVLVVVLHLTGVVGAKSH